MSIFKTLSHFIPFLLALVLERVRVREVVDGDGEEDVEQDVVAAHEQDDEVQGGHDADGVDAAERLDAVVHDHVPVLAGQDLVEKSCIRVLQLIPRMENMDFGDLPCCTVLF